MIVIVCYLCRKNAVDPPAFVCERCERVLADKPDADDCDTPFIVESKGG